MKLAIAAVKKKKHIGFFKLAATQLKRVHCDCVAALRNIMFAARNIEAV